MSETATNREAIRDALADSDVFGALADDELDRLVAYGRRIRHPAGRVIFQKGDPGDSLMVVLSGRIKIGTLSPDGREAVLGFIEPCRSFGEIALLDGKPRSADATAVTPVELFVLHRADVMSFIERHPGIALRIIGMLCAKLRRTTEMVEDHVLRQMEGRIARALLRLADDYGRPCAEGVRIELRLSQRELGGIVGLARENVNRQLATWRGRGFLTIDRGTITLRDLAALRRIAEEGA